MKENINVEKWAIEAKTHVETKISMDVFKAVILPHVDGVIPQSFNEETPVIVASCSSQQTMEEVFGVTKVKGGTRLGSTSAKKGEIIYFPQTQVLRVWWKMGTLW